jgi:two-component sensor histidine kinase
MLGKAMGQSRWSWERVFGFVSGRETGWPKAIVIAALALLAAILVRLPLELLLHRQIPFVTFFPAVLAGSLFGGIRAGALIVIVAAPVAQAAFGGAYPVATSVTWFIMASAIAVTASAVRGLVQALRAQRDEAELARNQLDLVVRELQHRARNTFSVLNAIATQSARGAESVESYRDALTGRVRALSSAYSLISNREWSAPLPLCDLLDQALGPFAQAQAGRLTILGGPPCLVVSSTGIPLALALHELATNAIKYGALSTPGGAVTCDWTGAEDAMTLLRWRETGGPAVRPPSTNGFGSRVIAEALAGTQGAKVDHRFTPSGVECDFLLPGVQPAAE